MKTNSIRTSTSSVRCSMLDVLLPLLMLLASTATALAAVRYVDAGSTNATPPYTNWATAARVIQDAVDAAAPGDEIVVTNGTYATGGRPVGMNVLVNRVAVDKPLTMRSVNGPKVTVIQGYQLPGTTNGDGAIRCVYLCNGSTLSGFTLTNGATGVFGPDWSYHRASGGGLWCEGDTALVSDCVLAGNSADWGGGGAAGGTLNNCTLTGNSAGSGGGAAGNPENPVCTLNNCTLIRNSAYSEGGGTYNSTLFNCTLTGNSAGFRGGGAAGGTLYNCTVTGNSARFTGGGTARGNAGFVILPCTAYNCIVYFNTAAVGANYDDPTVLNYCCTTPLPSGGMGNIIADPEMTDPMHTSAGSPCRGAGSATDLSGVDLDGEPWANPPSIGCDEYHAGVVAGPLTTSIVADYTNVATGFTVNLLANLVGRASANRWEFGDGIVVSNRPVSVAHSWSAPGDYAVIFRAYNESYPAGVSATGTVHVVAQRVHYVAVGSANPAPPYTSWATAAKNIQDAVDVASEAGALVLVTNGTYASGGRAVGKDLVSNRAAVDKPLIVRSVNGPLVTMIQGYQVPGTTNGDGAIRCVYLASGASLSGFTLTNGATRVIWGWPPDRESSGGGVWCESESATISNCVVVGNSAGSGGGAYGGTLNDCTLAANSGGGASWCSLSNCTVTGNSGGGASGSTLYNCTVTGNSAELGGGASGSTLYNCTLTGNSARGDLGYGGGTYWATLNNCTLAGNSAKLGGATMGGTLNHCALTGNSAWGGGGAFEGTLNNSTLTGNSAEGEGGGAHSSTLNNCIVHFNTAPDGPNYLQNELSPINYSCTTPMPTYGVGNITDAPLLVDYASGNLRLQSNSPCINAGHNAYAPGPTDLDGLPRIVSGTVDIGAYEFQGPGSVVSYAWLQHYNLPTDGSADATDLDADGHKTWQEWRCLTDPTNALSVLRLLSASTAGTNVTVTWQSVAGVNYFLERNTNLASPSIFTPLATNLLGQSGTTSFTDTNAAPLAPLFYRVGVSQ